MRLRDWRLARKAGLAETARALGITGVNPGGTLARIEAGSRQPDADMIERIDIFTNGMVQAADMHAVRLAWLKQHRPDKFSSRPTQTGAEEYEARP